MQSQLCHQLTAEILLTPPALKKQTRRIAQLAH